jgi:hypothetical protein
MRTRYKRTLPLRDVELVFEVDRVALKTLDVIQEEIGIYHNTVAKDGLGLGLLGNTDGQEFNFVSVGQLMVLVEDPSVVTARIVVVRSQLRKEFVLALTAPLETDDQTEARLEACLTFCLIDKVLCDFLHIKTIISNSK